MPRNHANKNMSCKNNDFALFSAIKSIEDTTKNAIQIPWSGRTVGSGRVATIIE